MTYINPIGPLERVDTLGSLHTTQGVILDPFSILVAGILRKHTGMKTKAQVSPGLGWLHSERSFKRSFVNAMHFAETMTVIGPVAQLGFPAAPSLATKHSTQWPVNAQMSGNIDFYHCLNAWMQGNKFDRVTPEHWTRDATPILPLMPDLMLTPEAGDVSYAGMFRHLYPCDAGDINAFCSKWGDDTRVGYKGEFDRGLPTAALMSVVFSFKRPWGPWATRELTNLAGWPPVCFFLPVLVPAGVAVETWDGYTPEAFSQVVDRHPTITSYRIELAKDRPENRIKPFGQPFCLTSVPTDGKTADVLRGLSDVFRTFWSDAAVYSAWQTDFEIPWRGTVERFSERNYGGEIRLDPMGCGRRIRGHNRYSGRFDLHDVRMVAEERPSRDVWRVRDYGRQGVVYNASFHARRASGGSKQAVFVAPSFFQDLEALKPHAMMLYHHLYLDSPLSEFVESRALGMLPTGSPVPPSMISRLQECTGGVTIGNFNGELPVASVPLEVEFDSSGMPKIFGLGLDVDNFSELEQLSCRTHTSGGTQQEQVDFMASNIVHSKGFTALDALASKSAVGLSSAFKKPSVKAPSQDADDVIRLFDEDEDEMW